MVREKSINKLYAFALAAVFSLTLAGCGGGGGTTAAPEPPPMPTPEEMCTDAGNHWVDGACLTPSENTVRMTLAAIAAAATAEAAQAAYDAVKDDVSAAQGDALQAAVNARVMALEMAAREADQKDALAAAAGMLDTSDLSTQAMIDAARAAIVALRSALADADDVSDADKAMYMTMLTAAEGAVDEAQGGIDTTTRRTNQMTALSGASTALQAALAALSGQTPTQAQLDAANNTLTALSDAIAGAMDLTAAEKATYQREADNAAAPIQMAQTAFDNAQDDADDATAKANAARGKALYAALDGNATDDTTALDNAAVTLSATGLAVDAAAGAGALEDATDPNSVTLKAGDSAGSLGGWMGTNYAHTDTGTKIVNEAVVYTNRGMGTRKAFGTVYTVFTGTTGGDDIKGYVTLDESDAETLGRIMASAFEHSGTQAHQIPDNTVALKLRGTYDGAPGEYRCTGACSSTNDGTGSPSALGGVWHFKPDAGAMVSESDANYLYYGWWVSKDKDGDPTAASAFAGVVGTVAGDGTTALTTAPDALTGSATYAGKAAGKYAMTNVLDGTGSGGHFTADVNLTAKFGANAAPNNGGVSGTVNNFMAGGEAKPWSVELKRAGWDSGAATFGGTGNEAMTVWSIDGNKASESGAWSGTVYDEKPGAQPTGDGSDVPTTVTGTFYSEFSTIGRMVGAFGANKQ